MRRLTALILALLPALGLFAVAGVAGADAKPAGGIQAGSAGPIGAEQDGGAKDAAKDAKDSGAISKTPPDPHPIEEKKQWVVDLRWEKSDVYFVAARPIDLETARATPRVMGRFALELYEGKTLVERVRFDFPGLIDGDFRDAGHADPPRLDRKLTSRVGVMFPRTTRGTRLELWDRATDRRWPLKWPLESP